jgi:hypothetical protein
MNGCVARRNHLNFDAILAGLQKGRGFGSRVEGINDRLPAGGFKAIEIQQEADVRGLIDAEFDRLTGGIGDGKASGVVCGN